MKEMPMYVHCSIDVLCGDTRIYQRKVRTFFIPKTSFQLRVFCAGIPTKIRNTNSLLRKM